MKISLSLGVPVLALAGAALQAQSGAPSATTVLSTATPASAQSAAVAEKYGKLPLSFEANQGQIDSRVKFTSRGKGYSLFLTDSAAVLSLTREDAPSAKPASKALAAKSARPRSQTGKTDVVRMELTGAARGVAVSGAGQLPGKANYFIGNDPARWRSNVPTYAKVKYSGVYPGVDLVYYGNQHQLEYDFIVAPGANPKRVKLHFSGAEKLALNSAGDLTVSAPNGHIVFHKPTVYQERDGQREPVDGKFSLLARNTVGFRLGSYDHAEQLVIDPVLAYSTYLGGSGGPVGDSAAGIAVDSLGDAFIVGTTSSKDFPTTASAYQRVNNDTSTYFLTAGTVFVTELNPAGTTILYSTYLGGSEGTYGAGIALDGAGDAYVMGNTNGGFPVTSGAFQQTSQDNAAFVSKLNPTGSALVYSTLLGDGVQASAIAVDHFGQAYVSGNTDSDGSIPIAGHPFQSTHFSPGFTGFVTKLNSEGSALVYSTYLGPTKQGTEVENETVPVSIALDDSGNAYLAGVTLSPYFPVTPGAFEPKPPGPLFSDDDSIIGFVSKLDPTGSNLVYSTYLGGSVGDSCMGIAVDSAGHAFVTGATNSGDFPTTPGSLQPTSNLATYGGFLAFITKFNPDGKTVAYSTFLGGEETSDSGVSAYAIVIDKVGDAFVTGSVDSTSINFPISSDAFQPVNPATPSGFTRFLTELNSSGSEVVYSTYFGGSQDGLGDDGGAQAIALDSLQNVYLAGATSSTDFPLTPGAFQQSNRDPGRRNRKTVSYGNAFVSKFAFHGATTTAVTADANPQSSGTPVTFTAYTASAEGDAVPQGDVGFVVDGKIAAHVPLDDTGHAAYTATPAVGTQTIVAYYLGDPKNYSSSTGVVTHTTTGQAAAPTFNPLGGTHPSPFHTAIQTASPGLVIYYTTDGTMPTTHSTKYTAPVAVTAPTTTIKAIAIEPGSAPSAVSTAVFNINPTAITTTTR